MRKTILTAVAVLMALVLMTASRPEGDFRTVYAGIAFYNLENLFDTIDDPTKNDEDFTPNGSYHWGTMQYTHKLHNLSAVLSRLCTDRVRGGAAFIGLAEVENATVLEDLCNEPELKEKGLQFIHYEGEDGRGIDVAALYNPKMFKPKHSELIPATGYRALSGGYATRGVLHIEGNMLGENFHFLVNHWPSRRSESPAREFLGRIVRQIVDSIQQVEPDARIVIMGDLNDDPDNKSITKALGAKLNKNKISSPQDLYDPWYKILRKKGQGTLMYDGMWNLFDQIIFTANIFNGNRSSFTFFKNEIFRPEWITNTSGKLKGAPKRTTDSGVWKDGYSDHFPTQIYLVKEMK
ncbi:MAG: endonuclease/exonuclease/phosphatase family protein [Bacteroidaceae bacterium]|nr:endonuclease/exonuclease/phosphatase family protein [Bacteroidaceae bacterium]